MTDYFIELDTALFLWLNSSHSPFWDVFMKMASGKLIWIGMYAAILYAIWRAYGWRTLVVMSVACALTVTLADQITASFLRPIFERLRPANPENPISELVHIVDGYRGGRYGFPSCHAANTFAIATLLGFTFNRWRFTLAILSWAVLNCYSRVYLGVHYPGDLLAGLIIGCMCGAFIYLLATATMKIWRGCKGPGRVDRLYHGYIAGRRFSYRAIDLPILVEVLTIAAMFACATAIFF